MKNKIKKISFLFLLLGLILIIGGGTYAFFNYTEYSNELITTNGLVYMKMNNYTNNITLNNVFPETLEEALFVNGENPDDDIREDHIIAFEVIGKNKYEEPVWFEIDLDYGEEVLGKTRIDDKYLKFTLFEDDFGDCIFYDESFDSIQNRKIYVDKISNEDYDEDDDFSCFYILVMHYDENIIISDTDTNADFRASDLNNDKGNGDLPIYSDLYASVKVKVYGDFQPKKLYDDTPASCFEYRRSSDLMASSSKNKKIIPNFLSNPTFIDNEVDEEDEYIVIYDYDESCGTNLVFPEYIDNLPVRDLQISYLFFSYNVKYIYISKYIDNMVSSALPTGGGSSSGINPLIEKIEVDPENTTYDSRDQCNALIDTETNTLLVGCKNTNIPYGVTSIRSDAFHNCYDLININIPSSVTSIGSQSFYGTGLTSINIPNSVTYIGSQSFYGTGLTSIDIPTSVRFIGDWAFHNCTNLKDVYVHWTNFNGLGIQTSSFDQYYGSPGNTQQVNLHVPYSSKSIYQSISPFRYMNII